MAKVTVYCVQQFWRDKRKLAQGQLRQFKKEDEAVRAGEAAARRYVGVLVFSVTGDPEFEDWSEPRVIARHGETPDLAA